MHSNKCNSTKRKKTVLDQHMLKHILRLKMTYMMMNAKNMMMYA